ncbi:MAG: virulence protein RhuM/Fic/DOC family protein [Candidatus Omnitrophota bacterium]
MNNKLQNIEGGKIVLYKKGLEVQIKEETVWLSQKQMADLFQKDVRTVNEHIVNIYREKELQKKPTIRNFRIVQKEGKRKVTRNVDFYNLDVIISVGYRVKSQRGTQFRIWATKVLKQHLIDGYTINEKRLRKQEKKYLELKNAIKLIGNVVQIENLSAEAKGIAQVVSEYTRALDILDDFDHKKLKIPRGKKRSKYILTYKNARAIIQELKKKFKSSNIIGQEKDQSFKSSIAAIYQSAGGKDAYSTVKEKAANLLYFVTKNHSFVDGNKRIAAALFIFFLDKNDILYRKDGNRIIDVNTLVALTIMIACSNASEKDTMIKVIVNLMS